MLDKNEEQRMFEENYNLIYGYMKKNKHIAYNLEDDDKEQILAIGLLKAVRTYDESKGLEFSTYAYTCMRNEIQLTFRTKQKRFEEGNLEGYSLRSMDEEVKGDFDSAVFLKDQIPDTSNFNELQEFEEYEFIKKVTDDKWLKEVAKLSDIQLYIVKNMGDFSMARMAKEKGYSKTSMFANRKKAIEKIRKAYGYQMQEVATW